MLQRQRMGSPELRQRVVGIAIMPRQARSTLSSASMHGSGTRTQNLRPGSETLLSASIPPKPDERRRRLLVGKGRPARLTEWHTIAPWRRLAPCRATDARSGRRPASWSASGHFGQTPAAGRRSPTTHVPVFAHPPPPMEHCAVVRAHVMVDSWTHMAHTHMMFPPRAAHCAFIAALRRGLMRGRCLGCGAGRFRGSEARLAAVLREVDQKRHQVAAFDRVQPREPSTPSGTSPSR